MLRSLTRNVCYYPVTKDHFISWCEFVLEKEFNITSKLKFEDIGESWLSIAFEYERQLPDSFYRNHIGFFAYKMFKREDDVLDGEVIYEIGDTPMEVYDVDRVVTVLKEDFEFSDQYESFLTYTNLVKS
jgi:hypothetical protein